MNTTSDDIIQRRSLLQRSRLRSRALWYRLREICRVTSHVRRTPMSAPAMPDAGPGRGRCATEGSHHGIRQHPTHCGRGPHVALRRPARHSMTSPRAGSSWRARARQPAPAATASNSWRRV